MLICKLQVLPDGSVERGHAAGEIRISQIAGDCFVADYEVELDKASAQARTPGVWRTATVRHFDHSELGSYDLLLRALIACLGGRSHAAVESITPARAVFSHPEPEFEPA